MARPDRTSVLSSLIAVSLLALTGCGAGSRTTLGEKEYQGLTSSISTVEIVAQTLTSTYPAAASILQTCVGLASTALQIDKAAPEDLGAPLITKEALEADPGAAAKDAKAKAAELDKAIQEEQTAGWLTRILEWGGWGLLAGGAAFVARLLGVPFIDKLTDPLVQKLGGKWINPILERADQAEVQVRNLTHTVESSMVGRAGLRYLDKLLGDQFAEPIKQLTKGEASSIETLFTWLAKAHATDSGDVDVTAVAAIIDGVKNTMKTTGSVADVGGLLNTALTEIVGGTKDA